VTAPLRAPPAGSGAWSIAAGPGRPHWRDAGRSAHRPGAPLSARRQWPGRPFPLGATYDGAGTNFAIFSEVAEAIELCLFDDHTEERIPLAERTALWQASEEPVQVAGLAINQREVLVTTVVDVVADIPVHAEHGHLERDARRQQRDDEAVRHPRQALGSADQSESGQPVGDGGHGVGSPRRGRSAAAVVESRSIECPENRIPV